MAISSNVFTPPSPAAVSGIPATCCGSPDGHVAAVVTPIVFDTVIRWEATLEQYFALDRPGGISWSPIRLGAAMWFLADTFGRMRIADRLVPIGSVSDSDGDDIRSKVQALGISTQHILEYHGPTRRNIVDEFADGMRKIGQDKYRPALDVTHFDLTPIEGACVLLLLGSLPDQIVREAVATAERVGVRVAWGAYPCHFAQTKHMVSSPELFTVNHEEACQVLGANAGVDPKCFAGLETHELLNPLKKATGARNVVITDGAAGAFGITASDEVVKAAGADLPPGIDHVGLGDRHAGLMSFDFAQSGFEDLERALNFARQGLTTLHQVLMNAAHAPPAPSLRHT